MHKFIKDPIHGEIEIPKEYGFIAELISCREMKRLQNLYQLGECFNVFPGAVHTRINHSIGVYNNAKRFINSVNKNIPLEDRKVILAAALLHDCGHGPRSHCFEGWTKHNHEKMTNKLISDPSTEINKILKAHNIDPAAVCSIIEHSHPIPFYYQIVSSQVDSDRIDYLARDSHFTGAQYGKIDSGMIFQWVEVINNNLVYDIKAASVIEDLLFARAQMFKTVYVNKKVICYEILLGNIFLRYKELAKSGFKFKNKLNLYYLLEPYLRDEEWDIDTFINFDDNTLNLIIKCWSEEDDETLRFLCKNYMGVNSFVCAAEPPKNYTHKDEKYMYEEVSYKFTYYKKDAENTGRFKKNMKVSPEKEQILIKTDNGIFEIFDVQEEHSLISKEATLEYKFYFYYSNQD